MSIKIDLGNDKLFELGLYEINKGNYYQASVYAKKIAETDEIKSLQLYNKIYEDRELFTNQNECLCKLYCLTRDKKYLEDSLNNFLVMGYYDQIVAYKNMGITSQAIINAHENFDVNDFAEFMKSFEQKPQVQFKQVHPITEEILSQKFDQALALNEEGKYKESNKVLDIKDIEDLDSYIDVIKLRADNLGHLGDNDGLIKLANSIANDKRLTQYAYTYNIVAYVEKRQYEDAKIYLHKLMESENIPDAIILAVPIILENTKFIKEELFFADQIIDRCKYTDRDLVFKALLLEILEETVEARKVLNRAIVEFGETQFTFIGKMFIEHELRIYCDSVHKAMESVLELCKQDIFAFLLVTKNKNIKEAKKQLLTTDLLNEIKFSILNIDYFDDIDNFANPIMFILQINYCKEVEKAIRELLIENDLVPEVRITLIRILLDNSKDKNIIFTINQVVYDYDFSYPYKEDTPYGNYLAAYNHAMAVNFEFSFNPTDTADKIKKKLLMLEGSENSYVFVDEKEEKCVLIYLLLEIPPEISKVTMKDCFKMFDIDQESYNKWYKSMKQINYYL